jgi:hypothetical protein
MWDDAKQLDAIAKALTLASVALLLWASDGLGRTTVAVRVP